MAALTAAQSAVREAAEMMWALAGVKPNRRRHRRSRCCTCPVRGYASVREPGQFREETGGVERYVGALALKGSLFEELLGKGHVSELTEPEFLDLAAFITPARRKIGVWLGSNRFAGMRRRLVALLDGWSDVSTADHA